MDQISRLVFEVTGRDRQGSKVLNDAAAASDKAHAGFSRLGSTLSGLGGPFSAVTDFAGNLGGALDDTLSKAQKLGLGLTVVGVGLTAVAARDQQAQSQLRQAISNTGASYSDYSKQIGEAIRQQENFAHPAHDTDEALNVLTTATQDTSQAIKELSDTANIAAEKHTSLADAATLLVRAQEGNTRALISLGIHLDGVGTKTEQTDRALRQLHDRLSGQAAASVDTFAGRLKIAETRLHDNLAELGKYGPEITAVGAGLTILASVLQLKASRQLADTAATTAETRAEIANAAARLRTAEAATLQAAAIERATLVQGEAATVGGLGGFGLIGRFGKGLGIAGLGYLGASMAGNAVGGTTGSYLKNIGGDAAVGAGLGSFFPGPGTVVGAGLGAGFGLLTSLLGAHQYNPTALNALAATPAGAAAIQSLLARNLQQGSTTYVPGPASSALSPTQLAQAQARREMNLAAPPLPGSIEPGGQAAVATVTGTAHYAGLSATQVKTLTGATNDQLHAALGATAANRDYATSLIHESDAATKAALSLDGQIKALEAGVSKTEGLSKAQDDLQASMHAMAQSVHDGTHALGGHSLAAEANRNALRDSVDKMLALIQAEKDAGVSGYKVRQSALDMADALRRQAGAIFDNQHEVDALLRKLGVLPAQIAHALGAAELLAEQVGRQVIDHYAQGMVDESATARTAASVAASQALKGLRLGDMAGGGTTESYVPKSSKDLTAAKKYGTDTANAYVNSYTGGIDSNSAQKKAAEAAKRLAQTTAQQVEQAYKQIRDQVTASFNLTSLPQKIDLFGQAYGPARLDAAANAYVRQLETWAHLLGELRKKGLNETALEQFEAAGVAAIPAMRQVLKDREIATLNKDFRAIRRVGGQVASAQVEATQGDHLANVLARLPEHLAAALEKKLKYLHIDVSVHEVSKHQAKHVRAR